MASSSSMGDGGYPDKATVPMARFSGREPGTFTGTVRLAGRVARMTGDTVGDIDGLSRFPEELELNDPGWDMPDHPRRPDELCRACATTDSRRARGICKYCDRQVQPGFTRGLKAYDTCCKQCAQTQGSGAHDENCGLTRSALDGHGDSRENARQTLDRLLSDRHELRRETDKVLEGAGGESRSGSSTGFGLLSALGAKSSTAPADALSKPQVAQGIQDFLKSWDALAAKRCARDPYLSDIMRPYDKKQKGYIKRDDFLTLCERLLRALVQEWFPDTLPLSTRTFVQQNKSALQDVYDVGARLGKGSYGVVHQVEHRISGEVRVCKLIRKGRTSTDINLILQEIHNMAMLDHPNVIKVYEYFHDAQYVSQIMEPCNGDELKARVEGMHKRGEEPYDEAFMCDVMKQTMRALAFMHSKRFAHKDLKPENIMFLEKGGSSLKIIDFGLAELFNPHSESAMLIGGTLLFMPPEVFTDSQMTMKCDIWSAGIVLYNMITGTYPFLGQWPPPAGKDTAYWEEETADRIVNATMAPHSKLERVSRQCNDLVLKMLEKEEPRRPNATQLLEHDWVQMMSERPPPLSVGVAQCLEAYARMSEMKKAIFLLMAHQSAVPAIQELRAIFTHFDVQNRGTLTAQDLRIVLRECGLPSMSVERIIHALDREGVGTISWTEFLAGALCFRVHRNLRLVDAAFATFDRDSDGKITEDDLACVLGGGSHSLGWERKMPEMFVEMIPEKFRPTDGGSDRRRKLWISKEQFRQYVGEPINPQTSGARLFAVS